MAVSAKQPFVSISVYPYYSQGTAVVTWQLLPEFAKKGVLVYRSVDGQDPWLLLNPHDEPVFSGSFVDTTLPHDTLFNQVMYRVVLDDEDLLPGWDVGFFETMSEADQRTARSMLAAELQRLRKGAATPAFLLSERREGIMTGGYDPVTHTMMDLQKADEGGGVVFRYGMATQTWVQILQTNTSRTEQGDNTNDRESVVSTARMPGYPMPVCGSLVILPASDERYVVGSEITPFRYRGLVSIAYQVQLQKLAPHDVRYNLPVPRLDRRLTQPAYTIA